MLFLVAAVMAAFCYGNPAPLDEQSATWDWARNETTLDGLLNLMPFPKHVHWPKPAFRRVSGSLDMEGTALGAKQVAHIKRLLHDGVAMARSVPFRVSYDWKDESASGIKLVLSAAIRLVEIPSENDSEAYTLRIELEENSPQKIMVRIDAETSTGVMRGVATLKQLFGWGGNGSRRSDGYACLPIGITITDEPEKQWRGLMVDVARHFRPLENLKSICRGMAEAKLNVMHLHLSDDQGWRFEMTGNWTRLHTVGGNGSFYTQASLRGLVSYAASLGIRVYPEFDMPGHCGAALLAYPELNPHISVPGPILSFGVFSYVVDPSRELVYELIAELLEQAGSVFPDASFHTGGDEVLWGTTESAINAWMRHHHISNLHQYFNERVFKLVERAGKRVVGWQEIVRYEDSVIPDNATVQWWHNYNPGDNPKIPAGIESQGLYLDHLGDVTLYWWLSLNPRSIGGEACMWSEWVDANMDTRIFPMVFAIGENMWLGSDAIKTMSIWNFYMRLNVVDFVASPFEPLNRATFRAAVRYLGTKWDYSVVVEQPEPENWPNETYNALYLVLDSLEPEDRVNVGGAKIPLFGIEDAAKPNSGHLRSFSIACRHSAVTEALEHGQPATTIVKDTLQRYASLDPTLLGTLPVAVRADMEHIVTDMSNLARLTLYWMDAVQSGSVDAEGLRKTALAAGALRFTLLPESGFGVGNGFKRTLDDSFLSQRIVSLTAPPKKSLVIWSILLPLFLLIALVVFGVLFTVHRRQRHDGLHDLQRGLVSMEIFDDEVQHLDNDLQ